MDRPTAKTGKSDPARVGLSDPLAHRIEWTPLTGDRATMCTHRLKAESPDRLRFAMTRSFGFVFCLFVFFGVALLAVGLVERALVSEGSDRSLVMIVGGSAFAGTAGLTLYRMSKPIVFDRNAGLFWKGRRRPDQLSPGSESKRGCVLNDIYAIQLIEGKLCRDDGNDHGGELNLILRDARRLHVVGHGQARYLREDADQLAEFLGVPVWNVTQDD